MRSTEGFVEVDWTAPLDVDEYVAACLPEQTLKGLFVQPLVERAERQGLFLEGARRYLAFKDYPCTEYNVLAARCARLVAPVTPVRQTLRAFGREAYPMFRSTVLGKVISAAAGDDIPSTLASASRIYSVAISHASARVEVEGSQARIELRGVSTYADAFHVGAFEGVFDHFRVPSRIRVRRLAVRDVDLCAEWG
jgi:uncharacterized protein (TIGR02265 family)